MKPALLSYQETAATLAVSTRTVRRLADRRDIRRIWIGARTPRITETSLVAYVRRQGGAR